MHLSSTAPDEKVKDKTIINHYLSVVESVLFYSGTEINIGVNVHEWREISEHADLQDWFWQSAE